MKKLLGLAFVAIFMMSMTTNNELEKKRLPCYDAASIAANNFCCEHYGEDYTISQYNLVFSAFAQLYC